MIVARLVYFLHPQRRIVGISAQWLAKCFVTADMMCFIIQAVGGVLIADQNSDDNAELGRKIYMAGVGVQLGCVLVFIVVHCFFYRVLALNARVGKLKIQNRRTMPLFWVIYVVLGLIIVSTPPIVTKHKYKLTLAWLGTNHLPSCGVQPGCLNVERDPAPRAIPVISRRIPDACCGSFT
jgi:hypothetical protein